MKPYWLIFTILMSIMGLNPTMINASCPPQARIKIDPNKPFTSATDSLDKLDFLVNSNKVSNNALSIVYAMKALKVAGMVDNERKAESMARAYKLMGIAYSRVEKESSFIYFNLGIKIADSAKLWKQKIQCWYNLSMLWNSVSENRMAFSLLDSVISLAQTIKDHEEISNAYNVLGTINLDNHNYKIAWQMYDSALQYARKDSLYKQIGVALGNLAKLEEDGDKKIIKLKEAIAQLAKVRNAEEEMAAIYINLGNQYSGDQADQAIMYYKSALRLTVGAYNPEVIMAAYNSMAYSYLEKGDLVMAESCLRDKAIPIALKENNLDWLPSLYDSYADVYDAKRDYKNAFRIQREAMRQKDIYYKQQFAGQVLLLSALLDLKNKELTIQNEERKLLIQNNRLQTTEKWLAVLVVLALGSILLMFWLQQRNRAKLQMEQIGSARRIIEMEESEKGRTARELHDITGQLVMGITSEIENIEIPDKDSKEELKNKIKALGQSIRQISHRMNRAMIEYFTFKELIEGQCEDVQRLSGISIQLTMDEEFPDLPQEVVLHFYRMIQELLTNTTKYAPGCQVKMTIRTIEHKLKLYYSDNGPGFEVKEKKTGMGLMNINERAKLTGGKAYVTSAPGKGTIWEISIPV
jgi:two-component system, NarL family, sensor kinase